MSEQYWLLIAESDKESYVAKTNNNDMQLVYRALSKWLIRGSASTILNSFWEYIDQYDNELEDALLDQLVTQAETNPEDPQITNVRSKDYSIDMSVLAKNSSDSYKTCKIECSLYVYFQSLKKKLNIDTKNINITMYKSDKDIETVTVKGSMKTPALDAKNARRIKKRSSKKSV